MHPQSAGQDPAVTAAWIAAAVSLVTLAGTLIVQLLSVRRISKDTETVVGKQLDQERLRTLNERFGTAADRLGTDRAAAVRLAAVYAMAGLADDWPENRQTCVDVLCAYLRIPYEPDPGEDAPAEKRLQFGADQQIRHTVVRVITTHLRDGASPSWQGLNFDLSGAVFDGGHFAGTVFSGGVVSFESADFSGGQVSFGNAVFSGGDVSFRGARFSARNVSFHDARFSDDRVSFDLAEFSAGYVDFDAEFSGGYVSFGSAGFSGGYVSFRGARFSGGEVSFNPAVFSGAQVRFDGAKFSGGLIDFGAAQFSGGYVGFRDALFSGGCISFVGAEFCGGEVSFEGVELSGTVIDFREPGDWSQPPIFAFEGKPPSGLHLPPTLRDLEN
jgi:uncharacterized protein YjbI with pentapeptide repeats